MIEEQDLAVQLERISSHQIFKKSKRSISFLKYICEKALNGRENQIKEYSIAIDAFGLDSSFNPQEDPRVRVEARRLRAKLEKYYRLNESGEKVLIRIPVGSYIPEFHKPNLTHSVEGKSSESCRVKSFVFKSLGLILEHDLFNYQGEGLFDLRDLFVLTVLTDLYSNSDNVTHPVLDHSLRCFHLIMTNHEKGIAVNLTDSVEASSVLSKILGDRTLTETPVGSLSNSLVREILDLAAEWRRIH